jgi:hypothetical protein
MTRNLDQGTAGRVLRLEITERLSNIFGGESFGEVGPYERLTGWAQLDLDPNHPMNDSISNLALAPREADGRVRYKVDVCIIRPIDLDRGNGWLFYEVVNRGTKRALQRINGARPNNFPLEREDVGTGFLLRNGFTIAWSGWQGDLVREPGRMLADLPVARREDGPITARVREEFILEAPNTVREDINEPIVEISDEIFIAPLHYPTADCDPAGKTLTVRARQRDPRITPPGLTWRFIDDRHIEIHKPPRYDRSALYEFIYEAKDPIVLGAGLAGIRDLNALLRYESADVYGNPNPLLRRNGTPLPHAMGFGLSQSGRVLREILYYGWNRDSEGRRIFDGVITFVTGSRRGVIAQPFVHVTRYSRQHEDHLYPGDQFPFTFSRSHDPVSGKTEGILDKVLADGVAPKIIHVDTESEIWSGRSSLVVTDCEGNDLPLPENVRVYLCNGLPHGPFRIPETIAALPANLLSYHFMARAAVAAMRAWVEDGLEPPFSCFPSRAAGTLVSYAKARAMFPNIPGVQFPKEFNELRIRDYSSEPPLEGAAYPVFVTACDADGNGIGGVRHPLVEVPVGTHVGWQIRREGFAGGDLFNLFGAFIPFAQTRAERLALGDPRPSLEERYGSLDSWADLVGSACAKLVQDRLLLEEDVARLRGAARRSWYIFDAI